MPKILENAREKVIAEARRQLVKSGYAGMTIRSVAGACGLGVGTVYNYFESKDMLIASLMLEDWQRALSSMRCGSDGEPMAVLRNVYAAIRDFSELYSKLFADGSASAAYAGSFQVRHRQLLSQLSEILRPMCERCGKSDSKFLPEFVAEALLTWAVGGKPFEELGGILRFLFSDK